MRFFRPGFSLVEVLVATFMFAVAAIPIYFALSGGAAQEVDATKLSMARKILESFRSEVVSRPFIELKPMATGGNTFAVMGGGYPNTISQVMTVQQKYKDFSFKGQIRVSPDNAKGKILEVKGEVTWTRSDGKPSKPEDLAFLVVEP